uniref:Uncharacterized protein n=1 Tax=Micrurus paraensis TaxID=1970185 RepID=A0A2D4KLS0_9SAUR
MNPTYPFKFPWFWPKPKSAICDFIGRSQPAWNYRSSEACHVDSMQGTDHMFCLKVDCWWAIYLKSLICLVFQAVIHFTRQTLSSSVTALISISAAMHPPSNPRKSKEKMARKSCW